MRLRARPLTCTLTTAAMVLGIAFPAVRIAGQEPGMAGERSHREPR